MFNLRLNLKKVPRRRLYGKKEDLLESQVKKVLSGADQQLIVMVRN